MCTELAVNCSEALLNYVRRKLLNEPQSCLFFQLRCFILVTQPQPILLSLLSAVTPAEDWQGWNSYAAWCHLWQLQIPLLLRHWELCSCSSNHRSRDEMAWGIKPRCLLQCSVLVEPPREAACRRARSFIGEVWIVRAAFWEPPERTEETLARQASHRRPRLGNESVLVPDVASVLLPHPWQRHPELVLPAISLLWGFLCCAWQAKGASLVAFLRCNPAREWEPLCCWYRAERWNKTAACPVCNSLLSWGDCGAGLSHRF